MAASIFQRWQQKAARRCQQLCLPNKEEKGVAKILQHEEACTSIFSGHLPEVVGPIHFDGNDEPPGQMDVSLFSDESPYKSLPNSSQDNTYPHNDDSSSEGMFILVDEDAEKDDAFLGLDHYEAEEGMAGFEEGLDEAMPEFMNAHHHQDPRTKTYEERDEPPPAHDAGIEWSALEFASLELLSLCDDSGARRGFSDELLTLLHQF
jgi:hypothetical protein